MYAKSGDRPPRTYRNKVVTKRKRKRKDIKIKGERKWKI